MAWLIVLTVLTSFADPVPHEVASSNGEFYVHVDPQSGIHVVHAKSSPEPLWSFQRKIAHEDFAVSDDGKTVAVVAWKYVQVDDLDEPGVELWRASGRVKAWSIRELVSNPAHQGMGGPRGWFWREWRGTWISVWRNKLHVSTTGLFSYDIDLATGDSERSLHFEGAMRVGYGALAFVCLFVIGWLAARAARREEFERDRRRIVIAATAPMFGCIAQWLYYAGIPFVPPSWMHIGVVPWFASVLMTIVTSFMLPRLRWSHRLVWAAGVIAFVAVPAVLRIL